jgi:hypothetical protein
MHRQTGMMVVVHRTSENCLLDTISFFVPGPMDNNLLKLHS